MLRISNFNTCSFFKERRESARFSRAEVLLMLRTYQVHPGDFSAIVETMVENLHFLDEDIQDLYKNKDKESLRRRLREKFSRMRKDCARDEDNDIRYSVTYTRVDQIVLKPTLQQKIFLCS